jgi:hypothetical protein
MGQRANDVSALDYIEMTTTSIAGTSGDGAVTCVQQGDYPTTNDAFGTGSRVIEYVIEDQAAGKFERGLGVVANNVLTRTLPRVTWNGTTYDSTAPSALQFGATPSTGDVRIRISATPDSAYRAPAARREDTTGARWSSGSNVYWRTADYQVINNGGASGTHATATEYYEAYYNDAPGRLLGFGAQVSTAVGASTFKLGIYEVGTDGLPGPALALSNALSSASTGLVVDETTGTWGVNAAPIHLNSGWYYIGRMFDTSGVALLKFPVSTVGFQSMRPPLGESSSNYGVIRGLSKAAENSYGTGLPSGTPTGSYTALAANSTFVGLALLLGLKNV